MSHNKNKAFSVMFNTNIMKDTSSYTEVYDEGIGHFERYIFTMINKEVMDKVNNSEGINTPLGFYEINKLVNNAEEAIINKIINYKNYIIPDNIVINGNMSVNDIIERLQILSAVLYTIKYKVKIHEMDDFNTVLELKLTSGIPGKVFFEESIEI